MHIRHSGTGHHPFHLMEPKKLHPFSSATTRRRCYSYIPLFIPCQLSPSTPVLLPEPGPPICPILAGRISSYDHHTRPPTHSGMLGQPSLPCEWYCLHPSRRHGTNTGGPGERGRGWESMRVGTLGTHSCQPTDHCHHHPSSAYSLTPRHPLISG